MSAADDQWLADSQRHLELTRHRGHTIAAGLDAMSSASVTVPSAALKRVLSSLVEVWAQELLSCLHPNTADVQMLYACLRAQTPEAVGLDRWKEPAIEKAFADDGILTLCDSEEELAEDAAAFDGWVFDEPNTP